MTREATVSDFKAIQNYAFGHWIRKFQDGNFMSIWA